MRGLTPQGAVFVIQITRKSALSSQHGSAGTARGTTAAEDMAEGADHGRIRDTEFWFEDGTIILIAQDIEFRVYKGFLASRFPVFSDMLSFPQPLTAQGDLQEDQGSVPSPCPTVYLSGDSARD